MVAQWLSLFPRTSGVVGSKPASAQCAELACSPCTLGVSSRYFSFLPQSKDMHNVIIKLSVVCVCDCAMQRVSPLACASSSPGKASDSRVG